MNDFEPGDSDWPLDHDILAFRKEPADACYRDLLGFAVSHCHAFSLVWRDQLRFDASAFELARRLEPWLCHERHADEWPGTKLFGSKAWVRWYVMDRGSVDLIRKPNRLYAWRSPALPEDPAFHHRDGRGWLGSISHEQTGWLDTTTLGADLTAEIVTRLQPYGVFE